ncbi:MAG: transcriptional regulator [Bdellovibrionaceae bacterium]|nr:transcriptional regulator [Pseudobdellovibrionaceae bacterium]|tara:strand:+ start:26960 stop:28240 length:1281 start_codon:yes stop_codon:yes gene_type:complete
MITRKIQRESEVIYSQQAFFKQISGEQVRVYRLYDQFMIGREISNDIVLNDNFSSRSHAMIKHRPDGFYLEDLNSQNGSFVNGVRIKEIQLQEGDQIRLGSTSFLFSSNNETQDKKLELKSYNLEWNKQLQKLPMIANSQENVLLQGESGAGKEIISRKIHDLSPRRDRAFVTLNCSNFNSNLIESDLFGHQKGSYTDAKEDRKGAFLLANGGTLLLDEIGDMPLNLQAKLLRVLENREVKPLGSDKNISVDVRVIAASHKDLKELIAEGKFRVDLYYRLNIIKYTIPALRNRKEDITPLLFQFSKEYRVHFLQEAVIDIQNHNWPGNIRELKNFVRRAAAIFPHLPIGRDELSQLIDFGSENISLSGEDNDLPPVKRMEKKLIENALAQARGNQRLAAKNLGMPKSTFHDKVKKYEIDSKSYRFQ